MARMIRLALAFVRRDLASRTLYRICLHTTPARIVVVEQSSLFNGLIAWDAGEMLDDVACVAARSLADDVTGRDVPSSDAGSGVGVESVFYAAAQLGATKTFCKGPDEGMLARAWGQAAKGYGSSASDAGLFQPLSDLANEAARRPRALVDAEQDCLCAAAGGQVRGQIGQTGAFWQYYEQLCRVEVLRQELIRVVDNERQGSGSLPYGDLPIRRRTAV
jgi:hypothetical protein